MNCTIHNKTFTEHTSKAGKKYMGHWEPTLNGMCFPPKEISAVTGYGTVPLNTADLITTPEVNGDQKVWDAKDRQSMAQTAMKSASEICAALINTDTTAWSVDAAKIQVRSLANEFYKLLKLMKSEV
jgi:hypothetical protein